MKKIIITLITVLALSMSAFAQGGTIGPLTWKIENNTLTISGEGAMPDYVLDPFGITPWDAYRKSIYSVVIEFGVTRIGNLAFCDCGNLSSIIIPNSVTSIGSMMTFGGCESLPSIAIPSSVTSLFGSAFGGCKSLTSIDVDSNNNNYASEDGILFNKNKSILIYCPEGKTGDYVIPNSVTKIESSAFAGCESLISITIPNSVIKIESATFGGCTSLTSITLPNSIISIGNQSFGDCTSLPSIIIPGSVTKIESGAFFRCTNLTLITNFNPVPVAINSYVFYDVKIDECTLEVPINSVSAYKNANVWKEFNIVGVEVGVDELPMTNYELRVYPNPTTGKVYIETESKIKVYNQQGQFLQETFGNQVDLSDYPKGVYLLQINGAWRKEVKQ